MCSLRCGSTHRKQRRIHCCTWAFCWPQPELDWFCTSNHRREVTRTSDALLGSVACQPQSGCGLQPRRVAASAKLGNVDELSNRNAVASGFCENLPMDEAQLNLTPILSSLSLLRSRRRGTLSPPQSRA